MEAPSFHFHRGCLVVALALSVVLLGGGGADATIERGERCPVLAEPYCPDTDTILFLNTDFPNCDGYNPASSSIAVNGLGVNKYCEEDGECQSQDLVYCDGVFDSSSGGGSGDIRKAIYKIEIPYGCARYGYEALTETECETLSPAEILELPGCRFSELAPGDLCEADGQCGTDSTLNQCPGKPEVYRVRGASSSNRKDPNYTPVYVALGIFAAAFVIVWVFVMIAKKF